MRNNRPGIASPLGLGLLLLAPAVGACDGGTADLLRELDAIRGDCTQEGLKGASEECVQMFERYAERSADGIETYVGALRAFDEAVQRRSLDVETVELGRDLSGSIANQGGRTSSGRASAPVDYQGHGGWYRDEPYAQYRYPPDANDGWARDARAARPQYEAPPVVQRGVLLPPDQRLRRPWLEEERDYEESYRNSRRSVPSPMYDPYSRSPDPWQNGYQQGAYPSARDPRQNGYQQNPYTGYPEPWHNGYQRDPYPNAPPRGW